MSGNGVISSNHGEASLTGCSIPVVARIRAQISHYYQWASVRNPLPNPTSENPPLLTDTLLSNDSLLASLLALPISTPCILLIAQWYAMKHTLDDLSHLVFLGEFPSGEEGHIANQTYKPLRLLGLIGYAAGLTISLLPLFIAYLDEIFFVKTIELLSLFLGHTARKTPLKDPFQEITPQKPCFIRAAAYPIAIPLSLSIVFLYQAARLIYQSGAHACRSIQKVGSSFLHAKTSHHSESPTQKELSEPLAL